MCSAEHFFGTTPPHGTDVVRFTTRSTYIDEAMLSARTKLLFAAILHVPLWVLPAAGQAESECTITSVVTEFDVQEEPDSDGPAGDGHNEDVYWHFDLSDYTDVYDGAWEDLDDALRSLRLVMSLNDGQTGDENSNDRVTVAGLDPIATDGATALDLNLLQHYSPEEIVSVLVEAEGQLHMHYDDDMIVEEARLEITWACACPVAAAHTWIPDRGVSFSGAHHWDPEGTPGADALARFDFDSFVPVEIDGATTAGAIDVAAGRVSLDLRGNDFTLADDRACRPNLRVRREATLTVQDGLLTASGEVAVDGTVELEDDGRLAAHRMRLGVTGSATFTAAGSSMWRVDSLLQAALVPGSTSTLTVEGGESDGARVLLPLRTEIGTRGTAAMTVSGESRLSGPLLITPANQPMELLVGVEAGAQGTLSLTGSNVRAFSPEDDVDRTVSVVVGDAGSGTMHLADGAAMRLDTLTVGRSGSGDVQMATGGELVVDQRLRMGVDEGAEATLVLDGSTGDAEPTVFAREAEIGVAGAATLRLAGESSLSDAPSDANVPGAFRLAAAVDGEGNLIASGSGSHVDLAQSTLVVGDRGRGDLQLTDAARAEVDTVWISRASGSYGSAYVGGAGSQLDAGTVYVGTGTLGLLQVASDATVTADLVWLGPNGTIDGPVLAMGTLPAGKRQAEANGLYVRTLLLEEGATLAVDSVSIGAGARLGGRGTFSFDYVNTGTLTPGDSSSEAAATGRFTVDADYAQAAPGTLAIDLGGTVPGSSHDQLRVSGTATLGGTLRLAIRDQYDPEVGDRYEVLTAREVRGTFEQVVQPEGLEVNVRYEAGSVVAVVTAVGVGIEEPDEDVIPATFALRAAYPNPFFPATTITYELPVTTPVRLVVYDVSGRELVTLVNEIKAAGRHEISFDGTRFASGPYFYRIEAGEYREVRRMMLVK